MVPSKNHVSSPITNQLATINALFNSTQSQTLLQSHSQSTSGTTTSGSNSSSTTRSSINEMSGRGNVGPGNARISRLFLWREKWKRSRNINCGLSFFLWQILFHSWENLMIIWSRMAIWRRRKLYQGKMFCLIPSTATDTSWKEDGFSEHRERDRGVRQSNFCLSSPYEWHTDEISNLLF